MKTLTKRNCLLYFRSPGNVAMSLIGVLMVLLLFILFLGENLASGFPFLPDANLFVTTWMLAGMCAIAPLTTSLGVTGTLVTDRMQKIDRDLFAAPVARYKIAGGYLASGAVCSFLMSLVALAVTLVWLVAIGAAAPTLPLLAKAVGILALASLSSTCLTFFIVTFVHKNGTYTAASTLVGTLGGFLAGIYLPIGTLPEAMQWVIRLFPPTHAAVLLRSLLLEGMATASYTGIEPEMTTEVFHQLGVTLEINGTPFPGWASTLVLIISAALFFLLAVVSLSRKKK